MNAQSSGSHEIGLFVGAASFQTDYGQRNHFMSNVGGNIGTSVGLVYYYQFADYRYQWYSRGSFFNEHFKLRADLSYANAKLNHFGKWVDEPNPKGDETQRDQIRAMTGTATVYSLGTQLEFYYKDVVDYGLRYYGTVFNPYAGIGLQLAYSKPTYTYDPSRAWGMFLLQKRITVGRDLGILIPINDLPERLPLISAPVLHLVNILI